jgi:hypothetical protein
VSGGNFFRIQASRRRLHDSIYIFFLFREILSLCNVIYFHSTRLLTHKVPIRLRPRFISSPLGLVVAFSGDRAPGKAEMLCNNHNGAHMSELFSRLRRLTPAPRICVKRSRQIERSRYDQDGCELCFASFSGSILSR